MDNNVTILPLYLHRHSRLKYYFTVVIGLSGVFIADWLVGFQISIPIVIRGFIVVVPDLIFPKEVAARRYITDILCIKKD